MRQRFQASPTRDTSFGAMSGRIGHPDATVHDPYHAFVSIYEPPIRRSATGPLAGLRFAAKDLFDAAGQPTGAGNPDWAADHPAAPSDAWAVAALLAAGAALAGKTHTDELSRGIFG